MPFQLRPYFPPVFSTPALENAPDAVFRPAPRDGMAPENFHAMSIFPEYFKIAGQWHLARESRMDCVAVWDRGRSDVREFGRLRQGDLVAVGRTEQGEEGILVHPDGFRERRVARDVFAFRQGRSRETAFSRDYDELYELLRHERDHGKVVWVMGPAFAFDHDARNAFSRLIAGGFVHSVLAGNALATNDLEASYLNTAHGQNNNTQESQTNRHYGPLPPVLADVYAAQDAMRAEIRSATTVICMATALHTIAAGNMTPSYRVLADGTVRLVYFYCVDISEFAVNKLSDRGSLSARGIITNVQDFIVHLSKELI